MRTFLLVLGVLVMAMGLASAQPQGLLVGVKHDDGTVTYRIIRINYLNIEALCQALGGTTVNLYGALSSGQNGQNPGYQGFNRFGRPDPFGQQGYTQPQQQYGPAGPQAPGMAPGSGIQQPLNGTPIFQRTLNPQAPLAAFVPGSVSQIVGIR